MFVATPEFIHDLQQNMKSISVDAYSEPSTVLGSMR